MFHDPELIPFRPPEKYSIRRQLANYIESFPKATYEESVTTVKLPLGEMLFVCDPDLVEDILVTRAGLFSRDAVTRRALSSVIDPRGLFLAEGADWRWQRRAVAPAFRHENLLGLVPTFSAAAATRIDQWRKNPPDKPIDIFAAMSRLTFDIVVEVLLGSSTSIDFSGRSPAT